MSVNGMTGVPGFFSSVESLSREEMERSQLLGLRWTLRQAQRSGLYRDVSLDLGVSSLDDVVRLPFTSKLALRECYPFGALAVPREEVLYFCSTSGTTGRPVVVYFTGGDLDSIGEGLARSFSVSGMGSGDSALLMIHPMMAFLFQKGLHGLGAMSVLTGPGNDAAQVGLARDLGITTLFGVPSYLLHLGSLLGGGGVFGRGGLEVLEGLEGLERIVTLGESLTPSMRGRIEGLWGAEVFDDYGSVELATGFLECSEHDGHHALWDHFLFETVDPVSGEPTDGRGELVFTTLKRKATPLIRYRTGDLVRIEYDECACGRTSPRIFPEGRLGEMTKVKGTSVYPSSLTEAVMAVREVLNFRFEVEKEGDLDRLVLRVEATDRGEGLAERLALVVKGVSNITPEVVFVDSGSLTGKRKTRHFVDKRP